MHIKLKPSGATEDISSLPGIWMYDPKPWVKFKEIFKSINMLSSEEIL